MKLIDTILKNASFAFYKFSKIFFRKKGLAEHVFMRRTSRSDQDLIGKAEDK